jgi:hypothetical protein
MNKRHIAGNWAEYASAAASKKCTGGDLAVNCAEQQIHSTKLVIASP